MSLVAELNVSYFLDVECLMFASFGEVSQGHPFKHDIDDVNIAVFLYGDFRCRIISGIRETLLVKIHN